jgi:hypothetical protein
MRRAVGTCVLAVVASLSVLAQDERFLNFSTDDAIQYGLKQKNVELYRLQAPARWSWPPRVGGFTTPFLRVALAANAAKSKYKTFTSADVSADLLAPEVHIVASSQDAGGGAIANVETIVVLPKGSKDPSKAIQPLRTQPLNEEYKNLLGFTAEGRGMIAVFPLSILREDNEVRVVFDKRIPDARGAAGHCDDCAVPLKLKNVR